MRIGGSIGRIGGGIIGRIGGGIIGRIGGGIIGRIGGGGHSGGAAPHHLLHLSYCEYQGRPVLLVMA